MESEEILSFMDLLDMDEEVIDVRANKLMERSTFTKQHLNNFIHLLQYKELINIRENSECDNELEFHFLGKLIANIENENVDAVCKIITLVLMLNPSTVTFKSEHLIQQILADIYLPEQTVISTETEEEKLKTTLLHLKLCGSILEAVEKSNTMLSLPFLNTPLEHLICTKNERLVIYFLTNTVPLFFRTVEGYNVLDRIWDFIKKLKDEQVMIALKVICCLSNYYLPISDSKTNLESYICSENKFWDYILLGLSSDDAFLRKQAVYLAKRAIDYIVSNKKNFRILSRSTFEWKDKDKVNLKNIWDNFFVLIDSLEEKQSNIVLPSMKLFELVKDIGSCWLNCAFNIGLKHDNTQVRLKCLYYNLEHGVHNIFEAQKVLDAINNVALFDIQECNKLKDKLRDVMKDNETLINFAKALPLVKWSPVPLYYVTKGIANFNGTLSLDNQTVLIKLTNDLFKIPCNDITTRKCIHINILYLIGKCCKDLNWQKYIPVCAYLQLSDTKSEDELVENPFGKFITKIMVIPREDKLKFLKFISTAANIDLAILYFEENEDTDFLKLIDGFIEKIKNISERQYSDKMECLEEVLFIAHLYSKSSQKHGGIYDKINAHAAKNFKTILQFTISILISDTILDIEKITFLFENLDHVITKISNFNEKEILSQINKMVILCLHDNHTVIDKKVLSMFMLCNSLKSPLLLEHYKQEITDMKNILEIIENVKFIEKYHKENGGRLRNAFYEKSCEVVNILLEKDHLEVNKIVDFIEIVIESGGYGCVKWILRIMNKVLPKILCNKEIKFDVLKFLHRLWTEIEELKSNSQYAICMKEFIKLITHDALLEAPMFNNIILLYCNKVIELSLVKTAPLYMLVKALNGKVSKFSHMVYILSEILLNPAVARKENRIVENVLLEILQDPIYGVDKNVICFNSDIRFWAASAVSKISDPEVLDTLTYFMVKKIEDLFKNKLRYHSNSQLQRALRACLQNLLFILLKSRNVKIKSIAMWCIEFLGRIPHQPFERICLEWYISLYFYLQKKAVTEEILNQLESNKVPLTSQFLIMYWIVMHKLKTGTCLNQEYEFLMEFLLLHIMGPVFTIRLQAQYLSSKLYEANESLLKSKLDSAKYAHTIKVVNNTLQEIAKVGDKSFKKLQNDYFANHFDIVKDFVPCGIYWILPRQADAVNNEIIEDGFLRSIINEIEVGIDLNEDDDFSKEWRDTRHKTADMLKAKEHDEIVSKEDDNLEEAGTIQKKYVPWKNMSDIDVYGIENKTNKTELIVVASLIDKLPNLGGMARTSEVFGVQTYVVDSLRHLQDKQFQGLSVSAERWVAVEEVRPGQPLKDYLMMKKAEGYSVVAAEQTSTSSKLQNFRFPKKTLLLLGNEKEGVPCDLLPLMDHCVEVPQQGVIRSLNVHVTAAIFIWEYARQNVL